MFVFYNDAKHDCLKTLLGANFRLWFIDYYVINTRSTCTVNTKKLPEYSFQNCIFFVKYSKFFFSLIIC